MKYRAIQYLIGKLSVVIKSRQEGLVEAALFVPVRGVLKSANSILKKGFVDSQVVTTICIF